MNLIIYADPKTSHSGEANSGYFIAGRAFCIDTCTCFLNYPQIYNCNKRITGIFMLTIVGQWKGRGSLEGRIDS